MSDFKLLSHESEGRDFLIMLTQVDWSPIFRENWSVLGSISEVQFDNGAFSMNDSICFGLVYWGLV